MRLSVDYFLTHRWTRLIVRQALGRITRVVNENKKSETMRHQVLRMPAYGFDIQQRLTEKSFQTNWVKNVPEIHEIM